MATLWRIYSAVRGGDAALPKLLWDFLFCACMTVQTWSWLWPVHIYGFGLLFSGVAVFCLVLMILQAVMSRRKRRFTSKLQRLNATTVVLSSLRSTPLISFTAVNLRAGGSP